LRSAVPNFATMEDDRTDGTIPHERRTLVARIGSLDFDDFPARFFPDLYTAFSHDAFEHHHPPHGPMVEQTVIVTHVRFQFLAESDPLPVSQQPRITESLAAKIVYCAAVQQTAS
jgi:hypothetical protein